MHAVVARFLGLSLGGAAIGGCSHVCQTPTVTRSFEALGETAPDVVAAAYVASKLQTGRLDLTAEQCAAACGLEVSSCSVDLVVRGDPNRPERVTGEIACPQISERTCHEEFDPFGLNSCPFGCGRRPAGVRASRLPRVDPLRDHVAQVVLLEALSVGAFRQLADDLRRHAPHLLPRIARAQEDERRHARRARSLLRGLGGTVPRTPRSAESGGAALHAPGRARPW